MPNLIMIDCHDLGQHLGSYGWKTVNSPNLDKLAAEGARFEKSFCTAPQCSPSRSSLYTGRYAHANGMFGLAHHPFNWRLHDDEVHLACYFKNAGYQTVLIGTQHVTAHQEKDIKKLGFQQVTMEDSSSGVAEIVERFLREDASQPFFLNIGFYSPHRDRKGYYRQDPPENSLGEDVPPYLPDTPEAHAEVAELQGVIHQMDAAVGRIWEAVKETGLVHDTWLIFTTDHGIAMPCAKCTLYDPGIETALIMYSEQHGLIGGRVFNELVSNVDIVPTILDLFGFEIPVRLQGKSFAHLIQKQPYQAREFVFAEKTFHTAYEPQRAIRTERYKLIWNIEAGIINVPGDIMHSPIFPQVIERVTTERPPFELYDLQNDELEQNNLIAEPVYAPIIKELSAKLLRWMEETNDPILNGPIPSPFFHNSLELLKKGVV